MAILENPSMEYAPLIQAALGLSHADIARACQDSMKDAVLEGLPHVSFDSVLLHLQERSASLKSLKSS